MDPSVGRFVGVDPFEGAPQAPVSLHRYLYANANPINFNDPSGQFSIAEFLTASVVRSVLIGMSASATGYGLSVLSQKFAAPEKEFAEIWSTKDFAINVGSGGATSLLLEIKVVAKLGILTINVVSSVATGALIRGTNDGDPLALAGILTDIVGAYVGSAVSGKGDNRQIINTIRGVMSGPSGVAASEGIQVFIDLGKDGINKVTQEANKLFKEMERTIYNVYGVGKP
jgi:hypothetical protein